MSLFTATDWSPLSRCLSAVLLVLWCGERKTQADGIDGNGVGARSMGMGGADVAWASDSLGAMGINPGGLGFLSAPELDLGGVGGILQGNFNKPGISSGSLSQLPVGLPEGAFSYPLGKWPVTLGLSFVPDSALVADWHYLDPPGGLGGVSYGYQQDKSEIIVLRSALGAGVKINSQLSFGASFGLVYNQNELDTPYIFQNLTPGPGGPKNSGLNGAKTLLDLNTSGYGWNAQVGLIFRPTTNVQIGLSYQSETVVDTTGNATGDPSAQFGLPPGSLPFHYNADVRNIFPQEVSAGLSWRFHPQWRAALQVDWLDWADAFHTLPVSLSDGSNPGVNAALGSSFSDSIPLNWKDEFVYRTGAEFNVTTNFTLRAGYCYGNSPVPDSSLTPMTAAIIENTLTAGLGYHWQRYQVDLAYQYGFPARQNVGSSGLLSGEYSHSSTEVSMHTLALTVGVRF
jgi:long-chain fatty acid transport protein